MDNREQQKFSQVPLVILYVLGIVAAVIFAGVLLLWML